MAEKAYIVNLMFGTWHNQLWFSAPDDEVTEIRWVEAREKLNSVGDLCKSSNEFFTKAVEHFESYGFKRVQK